MSTRFTRPGLPFGKRCRYGFGFLEIHCEGKVNAAKRNAAMSLLNVSLIAKQILNANQLVTEILPRARKRII